NGLPFKYLKLHGFEGRIYPVNPKYTSAADLTCYPSLAALPETPDVAIVGVAAAHVQAVLNECAELKIPAAVVYASGFAESSAEGRRMQDAIADLGRSS